MIFYLFGGVILAAALSLVFSTLTYSLRDFSKPLLEAYLLKHGKGTWLEPTVEKAADLIFVTAIGRLFSNILILIFTLSVVREGDYSEPMEYLLAILTAGLISIFCSVAIPSALASHVGEQMIGASIRPLHLWRMALWPVAKVMHTTDRLIGQAADAAAPPAEKEEVIEQEILSVVEAGQKEGVVDEQESAMIKSVIQFNDTTVGQIMTARPEIIGLEIKSSIMEVKRMIEESGHSRIPVYEGSLDHIVGILYARDLLKYLGLPPDTFGIRSAMRPAYYVPESKPLRDLLQDFRLQKVHIAIVLDEYGGTAGLVTIEDVLEELVGEISDEHEPAEPAMFHRTGEQSAEVDARIYLDELNRLFGLTLAEDAGYDTLGGFISTTLGRIPETGTTFENAGAKFTILDAEPQKVNRVRIELIPQPVTEEKTLATQGK
jgi:CBS domain containing-hemolysin-like protein